MAAHRRYGWHPSLPDHRDDLYKYVPNREHLLVLPDSLDIDTPSPGSPFDPSWDQSDLGSCGPNTLGERLVFDLLLKDKTTVKMPSRLFIYYVTRMLMKTINSDSGVDNRTMMKAVAQYGWPDEDDLPYNIDHFTERPSQGIFDKAKARANSFTYSSVDQDLDTMKSALFEKKPIIFGFTVYKSLETTKVDRSGDVPMPSRRDKVMGGHDVLIVGYNDKTQRFKFKNHWYLSPGTPWGNGGYGTIPYAYALNRKLAGDFWTLTLN